MIAKKKRNEGKLASDVNLDETRKGRSILKQGTIHGRGEALSSGRFKVD